MIRKLRKTDINRVADIWLKTNLKAHSFISEQYWISYVYEDDKMIQGFLGVRDE